MEDRQWRDETEMRAENRGRLKKYLVTILPTFGPVEIRAENQQETEELAAHYWDGEFVTEVEEIIERFSKKRQE